MSASCAGPGCASGNPISPRYRRILWIALAVNALMFGVEIVGGVAAGSSALQADALDFLGDAANYGISLFVLSASLVVRAKASILKGTTMAAFGCWVVGHALYQARTGRVPEPMVMGVIGVLALLSNVLVAGLLYKFRSGDSNMRSVWICSRNDALGNIAVVAAATGVFTTQRGWPDIAVALIMGVLSLSGAWQILRHARQELATTRLSSVSSDFAAPGAATPPLHSHAWMRSAASVTRVRPEASAIAAVVGAFLFAGLAPVAAAAQQSSTNATTPQDSTAAITVRV